MQVMTYREVERLAREHAQYLEKRREKERIGHALPYPSRVEQARQTLRSRAGRLDSRWITTELVGGTARARRRHALQQQMERDSRGLERDVLLSIAELPDADIVWLLSIGWNPDDHVVSS